MKAEPVTFCSELLAYNKLHTTKALAEAGKAWRDMPTWPNVTDMLQKQDKAKAIKGLLQYCSQRTAEHDIGDKD